MNQISLENRQEANEKVDKKTREIQVLIILNEHKELTPKQIARYMVYKKFTKGVDYNNARPRLTTLLENREVCIVGKAFDSETNCKEAVYKITEAGKERIRSIA